MPKVRTDSRGRTGGRAWWPPSGSWHKRTSSRTWNFLIPTISKDFNGVICRPSTPDRGLRWLKEALTRQGVTRDLVDPLTWHFRSLYYSRLRVSTWGSPHPAAIRGQLAYRVQGAKKRGGIDLAQGGIQGGQPEPQVGGSSLDTPSGEHRAAANGASSLRPGTPRALRRTSTKLPTAVYHRATEPQPQASTAYTS